MHGLKPELSIVIVNWNTEDLLNTCLNSIITSAGNIAYEIIVIDNGSHDGSIAMVRKNFPQVILVSNIDNVGFVKANNQGFRIATAPYVLMLNSDTEIIDSALEKTLSYFKTDPMVGAVGCKLLYPDGRFQNSCFRYPSILGYLINSIGLSRLIRRWDWDRYGNTDANWKTAKEVQCVMGSFIMLEKEFLFEIGCLDESFFMYAEETDLCYRIKLYGKKVIYFPQATIIHHHRGSQKTWQDLVWSYQSATRGILKFLMKWKPFKAYCLNGLIVLFLVPRMLLWATADFIISIHKKTFTIKYLKKAGLLPWHLKALVNPHLLNESWSRPK